MQVSSLHPEFRCRMEPLNYSLLFLGGGTCAAAVIGAILSRRALRGRSLPLRLGVWFAAGLACFVGSQVLGKGILGWWPFVGRPDFFARLVRVQISSSSGRMAILAFSGISEGAQSSSNRLFVADKDGEQIAEVCEGAVTDICWSKDGDRLYVLRSVLKGRRQSSKSLWCYTSSSGRFTPVRSLPRSATSVSLDPAEQSLLFTGPRSPEEKERFQVLRGRLTYDGDDRPICWREGLQVGHAWGPKTGTAFVATSRQSSFGETRGLWKIEGDGAGLWTQTPLVEMEGIEGILFNPSETWAALFVRQWPPRYEGFDLYLLDLQEKLVMPLSPQIEWKAAVWDNKGDELVFADKEGLWVYRLADGRLRLLLESPPSYLNPDRGDRLIPLSYSQSGNIVYQRGLWRLERFNRRTRQVDTLFHASRLRRYFRS
jgi:hypothetical protein